MTEEESRWLQRHPEVERELRSNIADDILDSTVREMDRGTMLLCAQIALAGTTPA